MGSIVYCDTKLDEIEEIHLDNYEVYHFPLVLGEKPLGPYGLDYNSKYIVTTNCKSNSITLINLEERYEVYNLYIGASPIDVAIYEDKAYVICCDSNSLNIVDINDKTFIVSIPLGDCPYSIEIDRERGLAYVVNFLGNSLSVIDCADNILLANVENLNYPTKVILSKDKKNIMISESYFDNDGTGTITIISCEDLSILTRIKVGKIPVDMYEEGGLLYVTNLGDGSISVIDIEFSTEINNFKIGGMPKGILKHNNYIYVSDYLDGGLYRIELDKLLVKKIASGREPNAMKII